MRQSGSVSVVPRKVDFALAGHAAHEHARPERGGDRKRRAARDGGDDRRASRDKRRAKREHAKADKKGPGAGKRKRR